MSFPGRLWATFLTASFWATRLALLRTKICLQHFGLLFFFSHVKIFETLKYSALHGLVLEISSKQVLIASQVILAWVSSWHFRLREASLRCSAAHNTKFFLFCNQLSCTSICLNSLRGFFFLDAQHKHSGSIKNVTVTFSCAFSKLSSDCMKLQVLNCTVTHFTYKSIATGLLMDCSWTVLWRLEQQLKDCRQTVICSEAFPLWFGRAISLNYGYACNHLLNYSVWEYMVLVSSAAYSVVPLFLLYLLVGLQIAETWHKFVFSIERVEHNFIIKQMSTLPFLDCNVVRSERNGI